MDLKHIEAPRASKAPQIIASFGACSGAFALGTGLSWTSPALPVISLNSDGECADDQDYCYWDDPGDALTEEQASWVAGLFTIGCLLSSFVTGYLMSVTGRKWTMIMMVAPFTAGWVVLTLAGPMELTNPWWFYTGRLLTGFGGGSFALAAPMYISEIAEPSIRGALGSLMQFMITVGVLFNNGVGALVEWDILTGICIVFPLILLGVMLLMPESPYFLIQKGKHEDAIRSLHWLRGRHYNIEKEYDEMVATYIKQRKIGTITLEEFFTHRVYLLPGLIMLALMFFQQYSGINAVNFYLTDIFNKADVGLDSGASATLVAFVQAFATGLAVLLVERFGRKPLLVFSGTFLSISIVALGTFFYLDENKACPADIPDVNVTQTSDIDCNSSGSIDPQTVEDLGWLPLTSLMVYFFVFSIGFGPLPWMMNGEFFSLEAKGPASTLACAFNWLCAFMVSKFQTNLENAINTSGTYWLYGGVCAVAVAFIVFLVPETKGKTPEQMKAHFSK